MNKAWLFSLHMMLVVPVSVVCGQDHPTLSLAAASDLVYCLEELNAEFQKAHPSVTLHAAIGSSGNFFAQIKNGAPFDVFLSADVRYPRELIKAGLADSSSLTLYAIGRIVLWTTRPELEVKQGLSVLLDSRVRKFAIANPAHAPYGKAAQGALEHYNLWRAVQKKIVFGENIAHAAQFIATGNADAGIVALALVLSPKLKNVGNFFEIPEADYPRLEQAVILTNQGKANPAAHAYLHFLQSEKARDIFDRYGFRLPK